MYSKLFNTDYMILDEPNEKIKIIHYLVPKINSSMNREEEEIICFTSGITKEYAS